MSPSTSEDEEAVADALTVDDLIAGKLDIESGIEEAVKANCEWISTIHSDSVQYFGKC
jgi:hypothetical protein